MGRPRKRALRLQQLLLLLLLLLWQRVSAVFHCRHDPGTGRVPGPLPAGGFEWGALCAMRSDSPSSIRDDQILVVRPVARFARRAENDWAVAVGAVQRVLVGSSVERVLPELESVLDGRTDVASAAARLSARCGITVEVARASLARLYEWEILDHAGGYRRDAVGPPRPGESAQTLFFALFSSRPFASQQRLAAYRAAIVSTRADRDRLGSALEDSGLGLVSVRDAGFDAADLVVAWGARLFDRELADLNRECVEKGVPLLVVTLGVASGWVGPLVLPGESACVVCALDWIDRDADPDAKATPPGSPLALVLAHLAALEVLRFAAPCLRPGAVGVRHHYDAATHRLHSVEVTRRPRCPRCGDLVRRSPAAAFQQQGVMARGR